MKTERHFSCRARYVKPACIVWLTLLLCRCGWAGEPGKPTGPPRYRVVALKKVTADNAKQLLSQMALATISQLPGRNALLLTGQAADLDKAVTVLSLIDCEQPYAIRKLASASVVRTMPSNELVEQAVGNISISTFGALPDRGPVARAVIDVHDGSVIAIGPVARLDQIAAAVRLGPEAVKPLKAVAGPVVKPTTTEPVLAASVLGAKTGQSDDAASAPDSAEPNSSPPAFPTEVLEKLQQLAQLQGSAADTTDVNNVEATSGTAQEMPDPSETEPDATLESADEPNEPIAVESDPEVGTPPEPNDAAAAQTPGSEIGTTVKTTESDASAPDDEDELEMNLPETLPIEALVEYVGKHLRLTYLYDRAKLQGDVTLRLEGVYAGPIKRRQLYPLLESVLKFKGFVMTRKEDLVTIVQVQDAMDVDPKLIVGPDAQKIETGDVIVTRVFELKHIDTTSAKNLLDSMRLSIGPSGVTTLEETKTLIVTGYAYRMPRIVQLLELVDKPGKKKSFRYRQLRYTMAKTLAEKVKALAEELGSVPITVSTPAVPTPTVLPGQRSTPTTRVTTPPTRYVPPRPTTQTGAPTAESVYLDADERTNRILMIGLEEQLQLVEELVDTLDVAQQDLRQLRVYDIEHVDAEEVRKKLQELEIISTRQTSTSTTGRITPGGSRAVPQTPTARPATPTVEPSSSYVATGEEGLAGEPQVVVLEATNSLLVNATDEQHMQIATIISYVDNQTSDQAIPYEIYPLENQKPEDLAGILEKLIKETIQDQEGKVQQVVKRTDEEIVIVPDENTFSLIVYASQKNQDWINKLIKTLDKRRPQVLIDVTLVEISQTDKFQYDLNVIQSFPDLVKTAGVTGSGLDPAEVIAKLATAGRDRFIDLQSNSGSGTAFYGDYHINALLTAMQSKSYGRVLAKPKILVNDNETGSIMTQDTTFVTKTTSIPVASGGTNEANLIQTGLDFQDYNAGITLNITPHISEGELLRLEIDLNRSDFLPTEGDKPPDQTSSNITTVVTVPDGSTIILGGMVKLNQSKGNNKVPILGDLPLIGALFRGSSNSDIQRKLYVFVKAEIIRPAEVGTAALEDLKTISEKNRQAFEEHEIKFQKHEDWPGIEPTKMDPVKVLDAL